MEEFFLPESMKTSSVSDIGGPKRAVSSGYSH